MSSRNRTLLLTAEAQDDFEDIRLYTRQEWGERQEGQYAEALLQAMSTIRDNPAIGRLRADLDDDIRAYAVRQHQLFYRLTATAIIVLRILHRRADAYSVFTDQP